MLAQRKTIGCLGPLTTVTYDGQAVDAQGMQQLCSYVMQEDSFHPTITAMEAVLFYAHMKLPNARLVPLEHKADMARAILRMAGLQDKEDARVGGLLACGLRVPGLSGGERRRLSLCCGVVAGPPVLFCDEATSGASRLDVEYTWVCTYLSTATGTSFSYHQAWTAWAPFTSPSYSSAWPLSVV